MEHYGILHMPPDEENSYGFYVVRKSFADPRKETLEIAVLNYAVPGVSSPAALDFYPRQLEAQANAQLLASTLNKPSSEALDAAA